MYQIDFFAFLKIKLYLLMLVTHKNKNLKVCVDVVIQSIKTL